MVVGRSAGEAAKVSSPTYISGVTSSEIEKVFRIKARCLAWTKVVKDSGTGSTKPTSKESTFIIFSKFKEGSRPCLAFASVFQEREEVPSFPEKLQCKPGKDVNPPGTKEKIQKIDSLEAGLAPLGLDQSGGGKAGIRSICRDQRRTRDPQLSLFLSGPV